MKGTNSAVQVIWFTKYTSPTSHDTGHPVLHSAGGVVGRFERQRGFDPTGGRASGHSGHVLSPSLVEDLNVALNESDLLDIEVDASARTARVFLRVLTLAPDCQEPSDRVVQLRLHDVSRAVASLRAGRWDDVHAPVEHFPLRELSLVVRTFGGLPIYGWEFIDPAVTGWANWRDRVSCDEVLADSAGHHVLELFQSGGDPERHLDIRIWFGALSISTSNQDAIDPADFAAGGVRWWDAMYAGDPAIGSHGIYPAGRTASARHSRSFQSTRRVLRHLFRRLRKG